MNNVKTMRGKTMTEQEIIRIYNRYKGTQIGELCEFTIQLLDKIKTLQEDKKKKGEHSGYYNRY